MSTTRAAPPAWPPLEFQIVNASQTVNAESGRPVPWELDQLRIMPADFNFKFAAEIVTASSPSAYVIGDPPELDVTIRCGFGSGP
ncbi:hypothetical protein N7454_011152 [Penicillium verhagenii]|nr:hypothetical protein N7454_011308 [Penicillium verhagenii]KAJ5915257.1 hypothetical protein N7454_011152 [Penicillium verhagenii]